MSITIGDIVELPDDIDIEEHIRGLAVSAFRTVDNMFKVPTFFNIDDIFSFSSAWLELSHSVRSSSNLDILTPNGVIVSMYECIRPASNVVFENLEGEEGPDGYEDSVDLFYQYETEYSYPDFLITLFSIGILFNNLKLKIENEALVEQLEDFCEALRKAESSLKELLSGSISHNSMTIIAYLAVQAEHLFDWATDETDDGEHTAH